MTAINSLKSSVATGSIGQLARSIVYTVCEIRDTSLVSEGNLDTRPGVVILLPMAVD